MHFRKRGNAVQVIRTTYDSKTKKAVSTTVGRLSLDSQKIPDELKSACTAEEIKEVETWMNSALKLERLRLEYAARTLPEALADTVAWLKTDTGDEGAQVAAEILPALSQLRRVLKQKNLMG